METITMGYTKHVGLKNEKKKVYEYRKELWQFGIIEFSETGNSIGYFDQLKDT